MAAEKKVLHIEDNLENRILIRRLLVSENYNVFEAENARQALDIGYHPRFDPNGYQYARRRRICIDC